MERSFYFFGSGDEFLDFLGNAQSGEGCLKVQIVLEELRIGITEIVYIARGGD